MKLFKSFILMTVIITILISPIAYRFFIQNWIYAVPTGDDPAFHLLTLEILSKNPTCILVHLTVDSCGNPLLDSAWQYPNIIHYALAPLLHLTDPLTLLKALYTTVGAALLTLPIALYLYAVKKGKPPVDTALWIAAMIFFTLNNTLYTYSEGTIFELLDMAVLLPLTLLAPHKPAILGALTGLSIISYTGYLFTTATVLPHLIYKR